MSTLNHDIHYLLLTKGSRTGTQVFFGEGKDHDFVITEDELGDKILDEITATQSQDYPDSGFMSYKFWHDGKEINAIIVSFEWKMRWINATNYTNNFIQSSTPTVREAIRENKQIRIALFAWFLYDKERLKAK